MSRDTTPSADGAAERLDNAGPRESGTPPGTPPAPAAQLIQSGTQVGPAPAAADAAAATHGHGATYAPPASDPVADTAQAAANASLPGAPAPAEVVPGAHPPPPPDPAVQAEATPAVDRRDNHRTSAQTLADHRLTVAERELMRSIRRLLEESLPAGPTRRREDIPPLLSWEMLTLLLLALNAVVAYRYLASIRPGDVSQIYQVLEFFVPAVLGTALVAYLDEARDFILRLSRSLVTTGVAIMVLLLLSVPHMLNFRVPVTVAPGSELVWGDPRDPRVHLEGNHVLDIDAFRPVSLTVRDNLALTPEAGGEPVQYQPTLWLRHLIRSKLAELPVSRYFVGDYRIVLAPVYPVTVETDSSGAELVAEGRFPELYLLEKARHRNGNIRFSPDSGRIRVPVRMTGGVDVDLPPGRYDLRLYFAKHRCARHLPSPHKVVRGDTVVVRFTGLACEPWNER